MSDNEQLCHYADVILLLLRHAEDVDVTCQYFLLSQHEQAMVIVTIAVSLIYVGIRYQ